MPDDTGTLPAPSPIPAGMSIEDVMALAQKLQGAPPPSPAGSTGPSSHEGRGWVSLLGEAAGGGESYGTTAEREQGGLRAMMSMGANMMANSGYAPIKTPFGVILGHGLQAAQQSVARSDQVNASTLAAQQDWAQKQQELHMQAVKDAIPLLKTQFEMQQLTRTPSLTSPLGPTPGTAPAGTFEGAIGGIEGTGPNGKSTANGPGQFLDDTWKDFAASNPTLFAGMTPEQIMAAKTDPVLSPKLGPIAINWLAQRNAGVLAQNGVTPSGTSLGIAHYVGPAAAAQIMKAPDDTPVKNFVSQKALDANDELGKLTAGQMRQKYASVPAPGFLKPATAAVGSGTATPAASTDLKPVQVAGPGAPTGSATTTDTPPFVPTNKGPLEVKSLQEYQRENPFVPTPEQKATFATTLPPETLADMAQQAKNAKAASDAALQHYNIYKDSKSLADYKDALGQYNTIVAGNITARADQKKQGDTAFNTATNDWTKNLETSYNKAHELEQQTQGHLTEARQAQDMTTGNKLLEKLDAKSQKASDMNSALMQMVPVIDKLPAGAIGAILEHYPNLNAALRASGGISPETADAVQLIRGLTSVMATEMKPDGLGSMREYEFNAFKSSLPDMLKSAAGQKQALAMLLNLNDRVMKETDYVRGYFTRDVPDADAKGGSRPAYNINHSPGADGKPLGMWQRMDTDLGAVIPHYTGKVGDVAALNAYRAKQLPGRPYYDIGTVKDPVTGKDLYDPNGKVRTREYPAVAPMIGQ